MKLRDIFYPSIDRDINPAVVVSNIKEATIKAEIEEYVFTDDILENLYLMLDTVLNQKKGKTGIWINGYYGSGKSHFIKYVHYCLDAKTRDSAFQHFIDAAAKYDNTAIGKKEEVTQSNIKLLMKKAEATHCDHIMFNVEDETDDGSGERLTRIFLSMFNRFRGYNADDIPTALLLEKYLDEKGQFGAFVERVTDDLGHDWKSDAADIVSYELESVLEIAKDLVPELDSTSLHAKLSDPETYRITIANKLIPEFQEFLKDKPAEYRLLFLVDEISQYVGGNTSILLNFQSIIEQVSDKLNNQVWIACTAQQSLEEVVSNSGRNSQNDEFGKILGRFDTRISLESNDAAFITQKRVLNKNAQGTEVLSELYKKNKDAIANQFKLRHELYKGYTNEDSFFLAYPFIPYQFRLISDVFQQFHNLGFVITEVKANERSVLGITHHTVKQQADLEVGQFISFDAFYNNLFETNLTHRGRRAIQNAEEHPYVKSNPFAKRVVKTLFMVSNLPDSTKVTFPSNLDNLTILMMQNLDENKLALQKQIAEVLDRLLDESIVRKEKDSFYFFNEDEINVQMLIKNRQITLHDRMEEFDALFRQEFKVPQKFSYGTNDFPIKYQVDELAKYIKGDFRLIFEVFEKKDPKQRALENSSTDVVVCFSEWFHPGEQIYKDFEWYCRTLKYFESEGNSAKGERAKTIDNFRVRNDELKRRLIAQVSEKSKQNRFISGQEVWEAAEVNGSNPADRLKFLLDKHLDKIYKHHKLATSFAKNSGELRISASSKQALLPELRTAETMVNDFITHHGNQLPVEDIINNFSKAPFGWRDEAILDILVHLVKHKKREFEYRNTPRYPIIDFVNKALSKPERVVCVVKSGEEIDQTTIDQTILAFRNVFNIDLKSTTDAGELEDQIKKQIDQLIDDYLTYEETYHGKYPFGGAFHGLLVKLRELKDKRDARKLFGTISADADTLKDQYDLAKGMKDFTNRAIKDYDTIQIFYTANKPNFSSLSINAQELGDKLGQLLMSEDPQLEFRHGVKAYQEIKKELQNKVNELRKEVIQKYEKAFDRLEEACVKNEITEANIYADKDSTIERINKLDNITELNLRNSEAASWESEQLEKIISFASQKAKEQGKPVVNEPEAYYVKRSQIITNESELEAYLAKTREELTALLKQNKTIILK